LAGFLQEEIEHERKIAQKGSDGKSPSIPGFEMKTEDAVVTLSKTQGNEKITVSFTVNDSVEDAIVDDGTGQPNPQAEAKMESVPGFHVEIEKNQQKLVFECKPVGPGFHEAAGPDDSGDLFEIEAIYMYSGDQEPDNVYYTSAAHLDPTLYDHFLGFLEERGIDEAFVENLLKLATHYEHAQYVALLKKIHGFVATK